MLFNKRAYQELVPFSTEKTLILLESFIVETETHSSNGKKNDNQLKKFLWSCLRGNTDTTEILTEVATVYTAIQTM